MTRLIRIYIPAQLTYFEPLQTCRFGTKPKVVTAMLGVLVQLYSSDNSVSETVFSPSLILPSCCSSSSTPWTDRASRTFKSFQNYNETEQDFSWYNCCVSGAHDDHVSCDLQAMFSTICFSLGISIALLTSGFFSSSIRRRYHLKFSGRACSSSPELDPPQLKHL
jgi:hypothetical protein